MNKQKHSDPHNEVTESHHKMIQVKNEFDNELETINNRLDSLIKMVNEMNKEIKNMVVEINKADKKDDGPSIFDCFMRCADKCDESTIDKIEHGISAVVNKIT